MAKYRGEHYCCLERNCKSTGLAEVTGSTGVERRRAVIRSRVVGLVILALILWLVIKGHRHPGPGGG
jgi:hypothetical protein